MLPKRLQMAEKKTMHFFFAGKRIHLDVYTQHIKYAGR